jgi:hypothetical protein
MSKGSPFCHRRPNLLILISNRCEINGPSDRIHPIQKTLLYHAHIKNPVRINPPTGFETAKKINLKLILPPP